MGSPETGLNLEIILSENLQLAKLLAACGPELSEKAFTELQDAQSLPEAIKLAIQLLTKEGHTNPEEFLANKGFVIDPWD